MARTITMPDERYEDAVRAVLSSLTLDIQDVVLPELEQLLSADGGPFDIPFSRDVDLHLKRMRRTLDALEALGWPDARPAHRVAEDEAASEAARRPASVQVTPEQARSIRDFLLEVIAVRGSDDENLALLKQLEVPEGASTVTFTMPRGELEDVARDADVIELLDQLDIDEGEES